jgi:hypothetical protein
VSGDIFRYNILNKHFGQYTFSTLSSSIYNSILISLNTYFSSINGGIIGFGKSQATGNGLTARAALIARGWIIYDNDNKAPGLNKFD